MIDQPWVRLRQVLNFTGLVVTLRNLNGEVVVRGYRDESDVHQQRTCDHVFDDFLVPGRYPRGSPRVSPQLAQCGTRA